MPIVNDASIICKGPLVAFGYGDVYYCVGSARGEERFTYLLLYNVGKTGAIGTVEETGRESDEPIPQGSATDDHPADVALRFENSKSVDGIIAALIQIRDSILAAEGKVAG